MNNSNLLFLSTVFTCAMGILILIIFIFFLKTYPIESAIMTLILIAGVISFSKICYELKITNDINNLYKTTDKIIDNQLKIVELDQFRHPPLELKKTDEYYARYKPDVI